MNQQAKEQALISKRDLDVQLLLLKIDKVQVSKIACSSKHSLVVRLLSLGKYGIVYEHWSCIFLGRK